MFKKIIIIYLFQTILKTYQNEDKSLKAKKNNEDMQKDIQLPVTEDVNNFNDIANLSIREEKKGL